MPIAQSRLIKLIETTDEALARLKEMREFILMHSETYASNLYSIAKRLPDGPEKEIVADTQLYISRLISYAKENPLNVELYANLAVERSHFKSNRAKNDAQRKQKQRIRDNETSAQNARQELDLERQWQMEDEMQQIATQKPKPALQSEDQAILDAITKKYWPEAAKTAEQPHNEGTEGETGENAAKQTTTFRTILPEQSFKEMCENPKQITKAENQVAHENTLPDATKTYVQGGLVAKPKIYIGADYEAEQAEKLRQVQGKKLF